MDGHFVPNFGMTFDLLRALRGTGFTLQVHLMVTDPERFIPQLAAAGADAITVHIESTTRVFHALGAIRQCGLAPGIAYNPSTPLDTVPDVLEWGVRRVLIMSVDPGFASQAFLPFTLRRVGVVSSLAARISPDIDLQVDGGVRRSLLRDLFRAGATSIVAGTSVLFDGNELLANARSVQRLCAQLTAPDVSRTMSSRRSKRKSAQTARIG
jgi:ribulose-phosphate 3-epimerase